MRFNGAALCCAYFLTQPAFSATSKEKSLMTIGAGCAFGTGVGAYLDSKNDNPQKSQLGGFAASCVTGAILSGIYNYFFMEDDQTAAYQRADHLEEQLNDMKRSVRTSDYRSSGKAQMLDFLKLDENYSGPSALEKMIDPACEKWNFSFSFDGKSLDDLYLPVSRDVIIKNVEFMIVAPKPGVSPETICVKPNYPFGYLNLELPGLDSLLYKHGEAAAKKSKGSK